MWQSALTFTFLVIYLHTVSARCDSFRGVIMTVQPDRGEKYKVNITGCMERIAFDNTIIRAYIRDQNIPKLGRDSVRNMARLSLLQIEHCPVQSIEPGAFRNVPSLNIIKIINGELEVIPNGVFPLVPELEQLKLNHNKIRHIDDSAFAGIPKLFKIRCDHNELREFNKKWFTDSTNLQMIDFSFNKIRFLPRHAFTELRKLKEISFEYNELEVIDSEAFKDIHRLDYLGLRYNRLKTLHPRMFPNDILINSATLDANYMNFLPRNILSAATISELTLNGNPWKCPCLDQILFWLHETNSTAKKSNNCLGGDVPVCAFPTSYSKSCIEIYDDNLTMTYLDELRKIDPPLERYCARLD